MPPKGYTLSEEVKGRISQTLKGRPGHPQTQEAREKISKASKGRKWSEESKRRLSEALRNGGCRKGKNHPNWKGGRKRHGAGYIQIKMPYHPRANPSGYVLEHIVIWEQHAGQQVPKEHIIHHLNGIKDDNRFENLAIMKKGEHVHQGKIYQLRIRNLEKELEFLRQGILVFNLKYPVKRQEFPK